MREVNLGTKHGIPGAAMDSISHLYSSQYHFKPEPKFKSRIKKSLKSSGLADGCTRGVKCPRCGTLLFTTLVICPVCADETIVWLVKSCSDPNCVANKNKREEAEKMPLEELRECVCDNPERVCVNEIFTVFPPDFLLTLYHYGLLARIQNSKPSEEYLLARYSIANKKTFFGTSLCAAAIHNAMGDKELYDMNMASLNQLQGPDELRGNLNNGISQLCSESSIERLVFQIGRSLSV